MVDVAAQAFSDEVSAEGSGSGIGGTRVLLWAENDRADCEPFVV